jgi:hypothetical protein
MLFKQICGKGCFIHCAHQQGNCHEMSRQTLTKVPNKYLTKIRIVGTELLYADRRTDMTKLIVFLATFPMRLITPALCSVGS